VLTLTMFAWSSSDASTQGAFLGDASARANLAQQAAQAVANRGADGINLDFEPIASGHGADFTAFVRAMRAQLDALVPGAQLTFDTTAELGNYAVADLVAPGGADAAFIMGYDYRTGGSSVAGSISLINGPLYDVGDTLAAYLAQVPPEKIILGLPWYGRAWSTVSNAPNAKTQSGTKYGSSVAVLYGDAVPLANDNGKSFDSIEQSAWTASKRQNCTSTYGCVTSWRELYFDDANSLHAKYDLINRDNLLGTGIWALGYDDGRPELAQAIVDKFVNDTTAPDAGIVNLPPTQANAMFPVSWTAVDDSGSVASYDVQVSVDGGPWSDWLTGTTQTSAQYAGATGHTYAFRVRATDAAGHVGAYDVGDTGTTVGGLGAGGFASVAVNSLTVRAGPDPAAQKVASVNAGAIVAITGGPVTAGGYTWYQVSEPIREWNAVSPVLDGVWVASGSGSTAYLVPARAPNSTVVGTAAPDTTPPKITAAASGTLFSPNGDGRLDTVRVTGTASGAASWQVLISPAADLTGAPVRTISGTGETVSATWDGRDDAGSPVPDGPWRLRLVATDAAGNQAATEFIVTLDVTPPAGGATLSPATLSPNGDGYAESATLRWSKTDVAKATIDVLKGSSVIRSVAPAATATAWTWDGRDKAARGVADGTYVLRLTLLDAAGNQYQARLVAVVDRTAAMLRWSPGRFAPASGHTSTVTFSLARAASTTLAITGPSSRTIRTAWTDRVLKAGRSAWTWDGRDSAKKRVAVGNYVAVLTVRTSLGTTSIMRTVVVQ
jgi:flagellar hook assembly protein FlgD